MIKESYIIFNNIFNNIIINVKFHFFSIGKAF